jgi:hypothetical protein
MPQWNQIDVHGTSQSEAAKRPDAYTTEPTPRKPKVPRAPRIKWWKPTTKARKRAQQGFDRLVGPPNERGCMEWQGVRRKDGYGVLFVGTRRVAAHRYAYQLTHQVMLTADQFVCHKCDNPPCVNPDHLWIGSVRDNVADMIAKGRAAWQEKKAEPEVPARMPRLVKRGQPSVPAFS